MTVNSFYRTDEKQCRLVPVNERLMSTWELIAADYIPHMLPGPTNWPMIVRSLIAEVRTLRGERAGALYAATLARNDAHKRVADWLKSEGNAGGFALGVPQTPRVSYARLPGVFTATTGHCCLRGFFYSGRRPIWAATLSAWATATPHRKSMLCATANRPGGWPQSPKRKGHPMAETTGLPMFGDPVGPWIKTFAWRPRFTFDGGTVWLRVVWKRHIFKHQYLIAGDDFWWQYRRFAP